MPVDYSKWANIDVSDDEDEKPSVVFDDDGGTWGARRAEAENAAAPSSWQLKLDAPSLWPILVGAIRRHPDDDGSVYPRPLLDSGDAFEPKRNQLGRIVAWGIVGSSAEARDTYQKIRRVECRCYQRHKTPVEQFVEALVEQKLSTASVDANTLLMIRCSLGRRCESHCWRRISVPATTRLHTLQDQVLVPVLGTARGMKGYAFRDPRDGSAFGPARVDFADMPLALERFLCVAPDAQVPIGALLRRVGDILYYHYDFVIGWEWELRLEGTDHTDREHYHNICLLGGIGADPPEDFTGGAQAYADFLAEARRDPKSVQATIEYIEANSSNYAEEYVTKKPISYIPSYFDYEFHADKLDSFVHSRRLERTSDFGLSDGRCT